jgi:hypothetical protein
MPKTTISIRDAGGVLRDLGLLQLGSALYQFTSLPRASVATPTNVASSASTQQLLASNVDRLGLIVFNDSSSILYLKYGATASSTSWTVRLEAGGYWEMPQPIYTGRIDVIWAAANGNARITELAD